MAERKNIVKGQIGNAIESVAPDHIAAVAEDIFDESRQQYQNEINDDFGKYVDNTEFVRLYLDDAGRIVKGIFKDGTVLYGAGVRIEGDLNVKGDIEYSGGIISSVDNIEFIEVKTDAHGRIIWAIQKDGDIFFGAGVPKQIANAITISMTESLEKAKEYADEKAGENTLAIEFEDNGDIVAYYGEEGINDVYVEENGDIVVEQIIND